MVYTFSLLHSYNIILHHITAVAIGLTSVVVVTLLLTCFNLYLFVAGSRHLFGIIEFLAPMAIPYFILIGFKESFIVNF